MLTQARMCLLFVIAVSLVAPATAQNRRRNEDRENVRLEGTLKDMGRGLLQVEAANGEMWLVQIAARPRELVYVGTAELDWLRPGMWVRFRGNFNQKLQADGPVGELTVFTPDKETKFGVMPQVSLGANLFSEEPAPQEIDKNAHVPCEVAGRIAGRKKNKMVVAAGPAAVTIELLDDTRVAVEVADLTVAQVGDQVNIQGWKYPMVPGRAMALSVTITGANPLAPIDPKRARAEARKRSDQSDGSDRSDGSDGSDGSD